VSTEPIRAAAAADLEEVHFDSPMEARIADLQSRYPTARAALLPILWECQERFGWISHGVIRAVADRLGESPATIEGVVTFYTMYRTEPPARFVLQVCETLSCDVSGGRDLLDHLHRRLGIGPGETTADGKFHIQGVQCLGACGAAPVIQINDDYYENLIPAKLDAVLDELAGKE